jgi:hypothetical protein
VERAASPRGRDPGRRSRQRGAVEHATCANGVSCAKQRGGGASGAGRLARGGAGRRSMRHAQAERAARVGRAEERAARDGWPLRQRQCAPAVMLPWTSSKRMRLWSCG